MHRDVPQQLIDRAPPHNREAERAVLGSLMLAPQMIDDVADVLNADEFYSPAYRRVYESMLAIHRGGKTVDITLVIEALRASGEFEQLGGMSTLLDVAECVPAAANALYYATLIREAAINRELRDASLQTASRTYDRLTKPDEQLAAAEQAIMAIGERRTASQVSTIGQKLAETVDGIRERRETGNAVAMPTPWPDLDRRIGGLRPELHTLAARPRMGKTALAMNVAQYVAERGHGVLFVTLEMSAAELCERAIAAATGINSAKIRDGQLSDDEMRIIDEGCDRLNDLPIVFDDTPSRTVFDIASQGRRLKRKGKLALLIVDHIGLIVVDNPRDPRHEQVSRITRRLKILARELQVPILALAQLNRDVEKDGDHRPRLSSLRESGSIEQDSGVVLFVHREEEYRPKDHDLRGKAELIVGKARAGESGIVNLTWVKETQEFHSVPQVQAWGGLD